MYVQQLMYQQWICAASDKFTSLVSFSVIEDD